MSTTNFIFLDDYFIRLGRKCNNLHLSMFYIDNIKLDKNEFIKIFKQIGKKYGTIYKYNNNYYESDITIEYALYDDEFFDSDSYNNQENNKFNIYIGETYYIIDNSQIAKLLMELLEKIDEYAWPEEEDYLYDAKLVIKINNIFSQLYHTLSPNIKSARKI